ncbi:uncharacterized protein METZ01_LOCUS285014 [marine metagenome]|uniref:Uncharacterized protein n=1 Tax=marine metagenome TaxID=408172 RepID=A0A382L657_9ZZZZ
MVFLTFRLKITGEITSDWIAQDILL